MAQKYYEGQEFHNPNDPAAPVLVYRAGKFYPKSNEPGGPAGNADQPFAAMTPGSENRTRISMGLGPAVQAQRHMYDAERWEKSGRPDSKTAINPFNKHPIATTLGNLDQSKVAGFLGLSADPIAKSVGGQEYQDYEQAAKSFESAVLPIFSGAAVTPSEAQRLIRASLPELSDTTDTLSRKATNRAMMINAAADLAGKPRPFPKVGTWDFRGTQPGSQPRTPPPPKPGQVVKGYVYRGGDPAKPESWQKAQAR